MPRTSDQGMPTVNGMKFICSGAFPNPDRTAPHSEGLKELHQILPFSLRQAQVHVLIIVIDDIVEGLKAAIMVKTTALSAPQSSKRCGPIHVRG